MAAARRWVSARRLALRLLRPLGLWVVDGGGGRVVLSWRDVVTLHLGSGVLVVARPQLRAVPVADGTTVLTKDKRLRVLPLEKGTAVVTSRRGVRKVPAGPGQFILTRPGKAAWLSVKAENALNDHLTSQHIAAVLAHYRITCVLDVGANTGQYVTKLRAAGYDGYVVSFEPVASTFAELAERAAGDERWTVHQLALGRENTTMAMEVVPGTLSSLLPATEFGQTRYAQLQDPDVQEVEVRRLEDVLDEVTAHVPDRRLYLKMDTQGFDLEAFAGLGTRVSDVLGLQSEVAFLKIYEGMPRIAESLAVYEGAGFEVTGLYPVSRERRTGRVLEFDCVMVRASAAPEA